MTYSLFSRTVVGDMLKQIVILSLFFTVFMSVNVFAVERLNTLNQKNKKIHVILDELDLYAQAPPGQTDGTGSAVLGESTDGEATDTPKDPRIAYLKAFFRDYNSVLYDHAEFIVATADTYQIDYRLVPAIAMQESNLCRVIPHGSHNCWGWGIYGNTVTRFSSYPEAIETVSRGLKKYYVDQGLVTPEQIMQKYTPSSNGSWARGVNYFFGKIE